MGLMSPKPDMANSVHRLHGLPCVRPGVPGVRGGLNGSPVLSRATGWIKAIRSARTHTGTGIQATQRPLYEKLQRTE
jgi:hypothetical protein